MLANVGENVEVIDYFRNNTDLVRSSFRHEQAYLSHKMQELEKLQYWPETWCRSFKSHCMPTIPLRYLTAPSIPSKAKIVIFHGNPNPPDVLTGRYNSVRKFWYPCPWVADHWHDNDAETLATRAA